MRIILSIPDDVLATFDKAVELASEYRPGLSRSAAIREAMMTWEINGTATMPTLAQLKKRADANGLAVRKSPSGDGLYAVVDLSGGGTTHPQMDNVTPSALTLEEVEGELDRLIA